METHLQIDELVCDYCLVGPLDLSICLGMVHGWCEMLQLDEPASSCGKLIDDLSSVSCQLTIEYIVWNDPIIKEHICNECRRLFGRRDRSCHFQVSVRHQYYGYIFALGSRQ